VAPPFATTIFFILAGISGASDIVSILVSAGLVVVE